MPEPSTAALLAATFAVLGSFRRRSRTGGVRLRPERGSALSPRFQPQRHYSHTASHELHACSNEASRPRALSTSILSLLALGALGALGGGQARAAEITWTGSASSLWSAGTNWNGANLPPSSSESFRFTSATGAAFVELRPRQQSPAPSPISTPKSPSNPRTWAKRSNTAPSIAGSGA